VAKKKGAKKTAKKPMAKQPTLQGIDRDGEDAPRKRSAKKAAAGGKGKRTAEQRAGKRDIRQYDHADKQRANNPPVGLVTPTTDPPEPPKKTYAYDPHLDPQLVWAGKAERTSFEVPVVSLHVHERIDPKTIIEAVRTNGNHHAAPAAPAPLRQRSLFEEPQQNPPLRDALDFYKHPHGWSNRLIAGDSLVVMNSLLEKEGLAGKVQMIYIDPPYGIKYGSNFQPFTSKRDVKDGKDEDLTQEPETLKAFRDTWELGIHSYLTYLRDRLLLAKELLHESGSCFVQIGDENIHRVQGVMDEVFDSKNFISLVSFKKTASQTAHHLSGVCDYLLWYAKSSAHAKYRPLFKTRRFGEEGTDAYSLVELTNGDRRRIGHDEKRLVAPLPDNARPFRLQLLESERQGRPSGPGTAMYFPVNHDGNEYLPHGNRGWSTTEQGMAKLGDANRLAVQGNSLTYVRFLADFPAIPYTNLWDDTQSGSGMGKVYVVQTNQEVIKRAMLMTTDPGDIVFDPTCGSGTTACVAEQWGRRWITCDTSRVAITLAKQRLMTAVFDYYKLAHEREGIGSGLKYKTVPHVTLKSIANNPEIRPGLTRAEIDAAINKYADQETLYDQPEIDRSKARVTGPFTVEAVPAITVLPIDDIEEAPVSDASVARSGATARLDQWRDELAKTGVRGKKSQMLRFARLESLPGFKYLHALGETEPNGHGAKRVAVSFGPEHAPLEQRQVELAWEDARTISPKPEILLFAAFHFDPEAAKDIDELTVEKTGLVFLKAQMNTDLLTEDLKKKRASNESYWLIGQPDVELRQVKKGEHAGQWQVEVHGFDYYNPVTGKVDPGDTKKIAVWLLDTDYDGRSLFPRQVFFPMSGPKDGWSRLAKNLKAEIDEDLIEAYRGSVSLPFAPGKYNRVAVKIVDDRGIESLKLLELP
jgi:adenine-specific DNA-methyltransferase